MKIHNFGLVALLLAALVIFPMAGADNNTTDPYHYLTTAEHLAGPKDMSRYSNIPIPEPTHTLNETTARLYPNMTVCGKDGCIPKSVCLFPFVPCENLLTLQIVYNVNASRLDKPGPVIMYSLSGWPLQSPWYFIPAGRMRD
jgi:hypothetical protein